MSLHTHPLYSPTAADIVQKKLSLYIAMSPGTHSIHPFSIIQVKGLLTHKLKFSDMSYESKTHGSVKVKHNLSWIPQTKEVSVEALGLDTI